jgi:hypothetical protein
VNLSVQK